MPLSKKGGPPDPSPVALKPSQAQNYVADADVAATKSKLINNIRICFSEKLQQTKPRGNLFKYHFFKKTNPIL